MPVSGPSIAAQLQSLSNHAFHVSGPLVCKHDNVVVADKGRPSPRRQRVKDGRNLLTGSLRESCLPVRPMGLRSWCRAWELYSGQGGLSEVDEELAVTSRGCSGLAGCMDGELASRMHIEALRMKKAYFGRLRLVVI